MKSEKLIFKCWVCFGMKSMCTYLMIGLYWWIIYCMNVYVYHYWIVNDLWLWMCICNRNWCVVMNVYMYQLWVMVICGMLRRYINGLNCICVGMCAFIHSMVDFIVEVVKLWVHMSRRWFLMGIRRSIKRWSFIGNRRSRR